MLGSGGDANAAAGQTLSIARTPVEKYLEGKLNRTLEALDGDRRSDAGGGFPRDGFDDGRDRRRVDRFDDAEDDWDEDDDEDWILEGFEEEMEDAAASSRVALG